MRERPVWECHDAQCSANACVNTWMCKGASVFVLSWMSSLMCMRVCMCHDGVYVCISWCIHVLTCGCVNVWRCQCVHVCILSMSWWWVLYDVMMTSSTCVRLLMSWECRRWWCARLFVCVMMMCMYVYHDTSLNVQLDATSTSSCPCVHVWMCTYVNVWMMCLYVFVMMCMCVYHDASLMMSTSWCCWRVDVWMCQCVHVLMVGVVWCHDDVVDVCVCMLMS